MAGKKNVEFITEQVEEKQKKLLTQIRTAPISEIAHKLKDCSADGGKRCLEPRFAVFLGAGASFQAGIKTAGQMMTEFREKTLRRDCPEIIDEKKQEQWLRENVFSKMDGNEYSKLFESFERTQKGRQTYISKLIKDRKPTFGYSMLASLIARGFINTILTTNFDDLMFIACNKFTGVRPVIYAYGIMATEMKFSLPHPKILKMHGDYLYSTLANTEKEMSLFNQDPNMKAQVAHALNEFELIVFGYSGSDESVMKILENYPGGKEFYWCHWSKEIPNVRVLELLEAKDGTLVSIEGFDDAMYEIFKIVDFELEAVLASYEERRSEVLGFISEFEHKYSSPVIQESIELKKTAKPKVERPPETWWEYYDLAENAKKANDFKLAEKYYLKAIAADPNQSVIYNNLGLMHYENLNKPDKSEQILSKAIEFDPNNDIAYCNLGFLYDNGLSRYEESEQFLRKAIELNPKNAVAYFNLGSLFGDKLKREEEGIRYLKEAIKIDGSFLSSYLSLSSLLKKTKSEKEFDEYIRQAETLIKNDNYFDLACLNSLQDKKQAALKYLKLAIEKEPYLKETAKRSASLQWISNDDKFWEIVGRNDENKLANKIFVDKR